MSNRREYAAVNKGKGGKGSGGGLEIYHTTAVFVHRQPLFTDQGKEHFRNLMRGTEIATGCRVLAYCIVPNHVQILLEVPPKPQRKKKLSKDDLLQEEKDFFARISAIISKEQLASLTSEIRQARDLMAGNIPVKLGRPRREKEDFSSLGVKERRLEGERRLLEIFERYHQRMFNLSFFMQGLKQRFTRWYNRNTGMRGTLWMDRFQSVIIADQVSCQKTAAAIDLTPVRAGFCERPEDYWWSSFGEASRKGSDGLARAGLVRAMRGHQGQEADERMWSSDGVGKEYRKLLKEELESGLGEDFLV